MKTAPKKFINLISYTQFDLWDTKRYISNLVSSKYNLVDLGSCINEESVKYKLFEDEDKEYGILGVNNKIGIFDAYLQKGKDINQAYKKMEIGWLAYNPYRINVGSIGIRMEFHKHEYISPAYVVFSCKDNVIPEYLFLLFKTETFNKVIRVSTTGSVRQNLTIDILKKIKIPLPAPSDQKRLVVSLNRKLDEAKKLTEKALSIENEIEVFLYQSLGLTKIKPIKKKSGQLSFTFFGDIREWGLDKITSSSNIMSAKYPTTCLEENPKLRLCLVRGKSPKYKNGTTSLIINQKCNRWNEIDLTFAKSVDEDWLKSIDSSTLTKEGDILVNSTGEGTIGRASIVTKKFEGLFYDSHLLLLRLDITKLSPELFVEIFNSKYGQDQVNNVKSAQATQQTELGTSNFAKIKFPFVENLVEQKRIVAKIKDFRRIQTIYLKESLLLKNTAEKEFEKAIFEK